MNDNNIDRSWAWLHNAKLYEEETFVGSWNEAFAEHQDRVFTRLEPIVLAMHDLFQRPDDEEEELSIDRELKQVTIWLNVSDNIHLQLAHNFVSGWLAQLSIWAHDDAVESEFLDEVILPSRKFESSISHEYRLKYMVSVYLLELSRHNKVVRSEIEEFYPDLVSLAKSIESKEKNAEELSHYREQQTKKSERSFLIWLGVIVLFLIWGGMSSTGTGGCPNYQSDPRGGYCD